MRGPDGCYYVACGNDAGVSETHVVDANSPVAHPHSGAIVRLSRDGKPLDVFAHGFRNPYDLDFDASSRLLTTILVGLAALAVLVLVMVWLARQTHRYLNPSLFVGTLVVLAALAVGMITLATVGGQVQQVRDTDFLYTVTLADARAAAYNAKSNESLTLIARGSGNQYEQEWQRLSTSLLASLSSLDDAKEAPLRDAWNSYVDAHKLIRADDDKKIKRGLSQFIT